MRGPCIPEESPNISRTYHHKYKGSHLYISGQTDEEKIAISPVNEKVSGLQHRLQYLRLLHFVVSLFEVVFGKELPYSDPGLFKTIRVFRKQMDIQDLVKSLPFFILVNKTIY